LRREFNSHSRSRRSETFSWRTDCARVRAPSDVLAGSRSISLSSTDCVTVCSGSHRAISFWWTAPRSLTVAAPIRAATVRERCFLLLSTVTIALSSLSHHIHRLERVQAAYPRVQFLPLFLAAIGFSQTTIQQSQRLRQQFRRLPLFQLAAFDLGRQFAKNRHGDGVMSRADAELRHLNLAVEAGAAVALLGHFPHE